MIYLKTYMYAPHELEFIITNLEECYDHIDKMIVCEFNINHTGVKREYEFLDLKDRIPEHLRDKLDYHACDVYDVTARAYEDEPAIHRVNEPVMRSWFTKLYDFNDNDIIISIDADEIIYGDKIPYIVDQVNNNGVVSLKMRQFFYKKTYLWENLTFKSAIACLFRNIQPKYPNNWRDIGVLTDQFVGCHFSWCMTPKEMVHKLDTYSHPQYRFCSDEKLLEDAIENKKYPFDDGTQFDIRELEPDDLIIPVSMRK